MWATGCCGQSSFEAGKVVVVAAGVVVRANLRRRPYFAQAALGSARPTLGERAYLPRREQVGYFLRSPNFSSLVIDTLADGTGEAGEQGVAVACFYFDFAAQKEQSPASVLSSLLRQVVGGLEQIPEEILDMFQKQKKIIGGRRPQLPEIVRMLGSLSSSRRTFFCLDAMDECVETDRATILISLRDAIKMSPTIRVFMTGRPHISGEVEKHLPGEVVVESISPRKDDIIRFIRRKLAEDSISDEMDESLEAEIIKKIPETVSEM